MRKAGIAGYEAFAREVLERIRIARYRSRCSPTSSEMDRQARRIAAWGENVYVKIPVTNTKGESAAQLACRLAHSGVKVNVTALLTLGQVREMVQALAGPRRHTFRSSRGASPIPAATLRRS